MVLRVSVAKTIENPSTKNTEFNMILVLLIEIVLAPFLPFNSAIVVPEMYAKNAGTIGSMHGATNEARPASAAIARVISAIN